MADDFFLKAGVESLPPSYTTLERMFGVLQAMLNHYEELKAAKWVSPETELPEIKRQIVALRHDIHESLTRPSPDIARLLQGAELERPSLTSWQRANLDLMRRLYVQISGAGDMEMVAALEDVMARTEPAWHATREEFERLEAAAAKLAPAEYNARKEEIYAKQISLFTENFMTRRKAAQKAAKHAGMTPSQVMLDFWNPYEDNHALEEMLAQAERAFPRILARAHEKLPSLESALPLPPVPQEAGQKIIDWLFACYRLATGLTEEEAAARQVTVLQAKNFPSNFCWGHSRHMRLSVHLRPARLLDTLLDAHHEYGHFSYLAALSSLPPEITAQPAGQINGYAIHEVSAMFFEMAALCPKYFSLAAPTIRLAAGASSLDRGFSAENMFRLATYPVPSELTTWGASDFAHLPQMTWRIRAERRILDGNMEVADIAAFRAATLAKFTGLPETDFADIASIFDTSHWAGEEYGYFPAYVFGAVAAAQLREKMQRERGAEIAAAQNLVDYLRIHYDFMNEHIYRHASFYRPRDLLERALGEKISIDAYLRRLGRDLDFTDDGL